MISNPEEMTPQERRDRIIELLAEASIRLAEEQSGKRFPHSNESSDPADAEERPKRA